MQIQVKLFSVLGKFRPDVTPGTPFEVTLPDGATIDDMVKQLRLPAEDVKVVFVNGRARPLDWVLQPGDDIGIFPPIGGG